MKKTLFTGMLIVLILGLAQITKAQAMGGVSFQVGIPQGEFYDNNDNLGFGISAEGFLRPNPISPVLFGLSVSYMMYGREVRRAPMSYTIPDVTVDVERTNNIANLLLLLRIDPVPVGTIKPYIDLMAGGSYLFTVTSIKENWSYDDVVSDHNLGDVSWNYGVGAGLLIQLFKEPGLDFFLDLKGRHIWGTPAEYLTEGDVKINTQNGSVYYNTSTSRTDMLYLQLGVTAQFSAM